MMNFIRLLPVIVSFILIAAHFKRADFTILAVFCLFVPMLLLIKRKWVSHLLQTLLTFSAVEWIRTMTVLVQLRIENEMDYIKLAVILGAVATFTACSCLTFRNKQIKKRYSD